MLKESGIDNLLRYIHNIKENGFGSADDNAVNEFKRCTANGELDDFLSMTLYATDVNGDGVYRQDYWQRYMGYNDAYDWFFNFGVTYTGNTVDIGKFDFTVNNTEYIIWIWKKDYI